MYEGGDNRFVYALRIYIHRDTDTDTCYIYIICFYWRPNVPYIISEIITTMTNTRDNR